MVDKGSPLTKEVYFNVEKVTEKVSRDREVKVTFLRKKILLPLMTKPPCGSQIEREENILILKYFIFLEENYHN